jgi:hypothetical protein
MQKGIVTAFQANLYNFLRFELKYDSFLPDGVCDWFFHCQACSLSFYFLFLCQIDGKELIQIQGV